MSPFRPRTTKSRRFPFLHKTAQRRQHVEKALDAIAQHGHITAKILYTQYGIPKGQAQKILKDLEASGHHVPSEARRLVIEGIERKRTRIASTVIRRRDPAIDERRKRLLNFMVDFGLERKILTVQDIAKSHSLPEDVVIADINYFKDHSLEVKKNPELRELIDLTLIKTRIYEEPSVTNERLADLLDLSEEILPSRLSRLRELDPETLKHRIVPRAGLSASAIDARTAMLKRFIEGEISREEALRQTNLDTEAFRKLLSRIRKRVGVSAISLQEQKIRKVVRQLALGRITFEQALERTGLQSKQLTHRLYVARKRLGNRPRADKK